ncbi:MAG: thioesterase domain-containing protein, partial [Myxococcota bacterium]
YRTGDRGRVGESGMLEHLGRRDHRVKVRGFTVELTEIEAALRQQPGVRECVVATTGRDAAPVAFVVTGIDPPEGERELRRALGRLLPDYMVPARIEFVSDFPLTATGKIDRRRLLEGRDDPSERIPRLAPRTATEERLAQIWTDELEADAIDIRDDYFALGGTSLQAVQIMMRIEEQFGRDLTPSVLLDAPTIERLAALIDRDDFDEPDSLVVALRGSGSGAPLFCFPGNGGEPIVFKPLVRRIEREHPCYGVQSPGLLGNRPPARRIAEYARLQLEGIREIQPNGPYHFVAFSFGCTVAHEVARQLEGAGERVAFIAMIDGWAPGHPRLRQSAALVHRLLDRWLGPGLLARHRISPRKLIHQSAKARARDLECMVVERSGRRLSRSQRRRRLKREAIRARGRYRPRPFPGRILLVRAAKQPFETLFEFDRLRGWGPFAAGGIETLDLDATHVDLLHDEFAPAIATAVNALLARSRSGTSLIDREARGPRAQ